MQIAEQPTGEAHAEPAISEPDRYICPLAYRSKCPAQLRLTKAPTNVVLEKINSHDAEVHSKDHAKGLKWQQKEPIGQAVSVAPELRCELAIFIVILQGSSLTRLTTGACAENVVFDE